MSAQPGQIKAPLGIGLYLILALALAVRIAYLGYYRTLPEWPMLTVDNWYHHNWALTIVDGNIFGDTTYFRAPFYVWCLALIYSLAGPSLWAARLFGAVVGVASVALTYATGRRIFNHRVGLIAALVQCVTPIIVYFDGELLIDPLFTLLFQAGVLFFLRWQDVRGSRDLLLAGLFFGLGAITRPTVLPLLVVPLWILFRSNPAWPIRLRSIATLLAGIVLCVGFTFGRNIIVAHDPVLVSSQGGVNFYIGNNDEADGLTAKLPDPLGHNWRLEDIAYIAEQDRGAHLKSGEISNYWTNRTLSWIAGHPIDFLRLYVRKLYFSFGNREISNNRAIPAFFDEIPFLKYNPLTFALIFTFAAIGMVIGWGQSRHVPFVVALLAVFFVATALFFFNSRFRLPVLPFLIIFASAGGAACLSFILRRLRLPLTALAAGSAAALVSFIPWIPAGPTTSVQPLISAALYEYHRGDFREAILLCETALKYDSTFPETHLTIGTAYLRMGRLDSAETYFEREAKLHPLRSKADINLASLKYLRGDMMGALTNVTRAVEARPYDPTAQTLLVRVFGRMPELSRDALDEIVRKGAEELGNNPQFLLESAHTYALRGDSAEMRRLLILAGDATPPACETDNRMFDPDYRQARAAFNRDRAEALHLLSYSYGLMGEVDRAIAAARKAIAADSGYSPAYVNLSAGLRLLGHSVEADSVLNDARRRFPDDTILH